MTLFVTRLCAARLCAWCDTPPDQSLCDCSCHDTHQESPDPPTGTTPPTITRR